MSDPRILIVDDDAELQGLLVRLLGQEGWEVHSALTVKEGERLLALHRPPVVLLDVMLADANGLDVCRRWRAQQPDLGILMVSARGDPMDKVLGLEVGADDYLAKPFNPRELLARIKAILRRRGSDEHPGAPSFDPEAIYFGPFELNLATRTLTRDRHIVPITTGEFSVLKVFGRHPKIPISREKLMELARGREYEAYDRSLDVQISRLRKLIEVNPSKPAYIQTVWGHGYVFVPDGG